MCEEHPVGVSEMANEDTNKLLNWHFDKKKLAKSHNLSLSLFCNFIFRGIKEGGGGLVEMVVGGWYGFVVHLQTSFEVFNVSPFNS